MPPIVAEASFSNVAPYGPGDTSLSSTLSFRSPVSTFKSYLDSFSFISAKFSLIGINGFYYLTLVATSFLGEFIISLIILAPETSFWPLSIAVCVFR